MNTRNLYPRPHPQTAGRVIDGEAVLILADTSEINVLNRTGSVIFELADGDHSVADIVAVITGRFETTYQEAEADTLDFVQEMVAQNVMVLERREP